MSNEEINVKNVQYSVADGRTHITKLTLADDTVKYIFIYSDIIFVSDWPLEEFKQHVDNDELDSYEAYDLSDGCAYYLSSKYASEIADAMINFLHHLL